MIDWPLTLNFVTASAAAFAAVSTGVGAYIYWKTFKSIEKQSEASRRQVEISQAQFDLAEADRKRRFDPVVSVKIGPLHGGSGGTEVKFTFTIHNFGMESIQVRWIIRYQPTSASAAA